MPAPRLRAWSRQVWWQGAFPWLTQERAKQALRETARNIGPPGWDRDSGAGIIDAHAAYYELMLEYMTPMLTVLGS